MQNVRFNTIDMSINTPEVKINENGNQNASNLYFINKLYNIFKNMGYLNLFYCLISTYFGFLARVLLHFDGSI
jgi:hypothetical protein